MKIRFSEQIDTPVRHTNQMQPIDFLSSLQGEGERGGRFTFEQRLNIGKLVSASIILSIVRGLDVGPLLWLFFVDHGKL